jgi:hypothetical protein
MLIEETARKIGLLCIKASVTARRQEFRQRLERLSFELVESVAIRDTKAASQALAALDNLIRFGKTIYEIEPMNAEHILQECIGFRKEIRQIAELGLPDKEFVQQGVIFPNFVGETTKEPELKQQGNNAAINNSAKKQDIKLPNSQKDTTENSVSKKDSNQKKNKPSQTIDDLSAENNTTIRHDEIMEKIRQFGKKQFQLKDIIAEFPHVSERTLRYDLRRFCNQGYIERIGMGGPGTSYRLREI